MVTTHTTGAPTGPVFTRFSSDAEELQYLSDWQDLVIRALRNPNFSPEYFRLYLALIDLYPQLLDGEAVDIEVWRVREHAGWARKRTTTNFFRDMSTINAFDYDAGEFKKKEEERIGHLAPTTDVFDVPEVFDMRNLERKRKAAEAEAKRRKQFVNPRQIIQCDKCGSTEIVWDATARCTGCGHVHEPYTDIPASMITIQAEIIEEAEDQMVQFENFLDTQPTAKLVAIRPVAQQLPMVEQPRPRSLPARPDEKCTKCGRLRRDCFENSEGTWWYSCTPQMWDAYEKSRK